nr:hypothetical transcript [Hymenolepis microstoma]
MEWYLIDPKTLDFGNLTSVFWTIIFCGCLLVITLIGICCFSCCLCCRRRRQRKIQRRLSASSVLFPEAYTEAVKMTSPTQAVSPRPKVSPASPKNNRDSCVTPTGTLEPSAPYPTLPYVTNQ